MCLLVRLVGKRVTSKVFTLTPEIAEKYAGTGAAELSSAGRGRRAAVGAAVGGNDGAAVDGTSGSSHLAATSSLALDPADAPTGDDFTGGGSTPASSADGELAGRRPSAGLVIALILLPILLIALGTVGGLVAEEGSTAAHVVSFLGAPAFALLVATLAAMYLLGMMHGWGRAQISEVMDGALGPAAIVILVTGAGGVFAKVLTETGVGDAVSGLLLDAGVPILLLAFLVALAFKVAQGSGTVATLSAAGIVQGTVMAGDYSSMQVVLIILAIGLGSVSLSHINDSGFWIATKFLGLSVADGLRTWTVLTSVLGFTSMLLLSLAWMVV